MRRRVVVTGMAGLCPLGSDWPAVRARLLAGRSGVRVMPEWDVYEGLDTRLGAPVPEFTVPDHYTRKKVRSMGRVALLATRATELALADAGLLGSSIVTDGTTGIAYGSTSGSPPAPSPMGPADSQTIMATGESFEAYHADASSSPLNLERRSAR